MGGSSGFCEAVLGKISFDFDGEGHGVKLDFEAVKRDKKGEEHQWTALVEGYEGFQ